MPICSQQRHRGIENPFGIVDLNSGAFTLIGNMGSGGYDGLAVANGVLYTEQNGLLYSVNTANANLTLIGGVTGTPNLATFGSTTTGLYGLAGTGSFEVATLFSINPQTGAITAIGPIGASAIPNGQTYYQRLSVGSSTLYMEYNSNLYTINTTTGAATQVGTTDSNGYLSSVLLLEYGTYYVAAGSGIATINVATGQIDPHSSIFGGPGSPVALAPDPLVTPTPAVTLVANAEGGVATIAPNTWVEISSKAGRARRSICSRRASRIGSTDWRWPLWGIGTLAEDAAQEALLRIWKGLAGFRGGSTLSTWIYAITRNASLTALAASRSRAGISMEEPAALAVAEGHGRPGAPARAVLDVEAMVGQLRPQYSQVLRLYYMQERSYEEVARMLDLPMGTVKTLLHRAKLELAAQLMGPR
jgi:RNA polymerase sigma factor (sigma-70 family)